MASRPWEAGPELDEYNQFMAENCVCEEELGEIFERRLAEAGCE